MGSQKHGKLQGCSHDPLEEGVGVVEEEGVEEEGVVEEVGVEGVVAEHADP